MTSLAGRTLIDTYKDLLQVSNNNIGVDETSRYIEDGEGTPSMLSLSTTSVGIGTTSPGSILDIYDPTSSVTTLTLGRSGEVPTIKAGGTNTDLRLEAVGSGGFLDFRTNNSTRMRISADGNVGIGTTSPSDDLHVYGSGTQASIRIGSDNGTGNRVFINSLANNNYIDSYGYDEYQKLKIDAKDLLLNSSSGGNVGIGTTAPERELHIKSSNGAQIQLESTSSGDWSGIDFKGGNGAFAGFLGLEDATGTFFHDISGNNFEFRDTGSEVVIAPTVISPGALLKITKDTTSVSCIRDYGNGLQWAKLLQLGSDRARESTETDRVDAIHVIASCTQFLSGTGSYISNTNSSVHPDGGAYWAVPAIYRSTGVGGGTFPFDKWGELILQGSSYGSNYNMGVTVATWDGVEGVEPQARARISKDGIQSFSQPFASVKMNNDNSQGGQLKTVGPPGGGAVIESADSVVMEFETIEVNRGNVYDATNKRFVAPVAGDYQISFNSNIMTRWMNSPTNTSNITYYTVYVHKNGALWGRAYNSKLTADTLQTWSHVSLTFDVPMQANDYLDLRLWCSSGYVYADSDGSYTMASFRLLG